MNLILCLLLFLLNLKNLEGKYIYSLNLFFIPIAEVVISIDINDDVLRFRAEAKPIKGIYAITGHKRIWYHSVLKITDNEFFALEVNTGEERRSKGSDKKIEKRLKFAEDDRKKDWAAIAIDVISGNSVGKISFDENTLNVMTTPYGFLLIPEKIRNPKAFSEVQIFMKNSLPEKWIVKKVMGIAEVSLVMKKRFR